MLKLIKYEFRKQVQSKVLIGILLAVLQVWFFIALSSDDSEKLAQPALWLLLLAFGAIFYVSLECIITYSKDLKTRTSYMLFMTPNTSYTIIGAKVLATAIQILLVSGVFLLIGWIDWKALTNKYGELEMIIDFVRDTFSLDIESEIIVIGIASLVVTWIFRVMVAFFSITLSKTLMAEKKGKGLVSLILFIGINYLFSFIVKLVVGDAILFSKTDYWISIIVAIIFSIISYVGTAWMLEEKISL